MRVVGIDLAGSPKNASGFALLVNKHVKCKLLHEDDEIMREVIKACPELIAFDAPLSLPKQGAWRLCDYELRPYGTLPLTTKGMLMLANRAMRLAERMRNVGFTVIEVFSTATAKILGYYSQNMTEMQKKLLKMGLKGDVEKRMLTKDEIDAISAAITAYFHLQRLTKKVGDAREGQIVIPNP